MVTRKHYTIVLIYFKCEFLDAECFQTINCIYRLFFIFEVYYEIVFLLVLF